MLYFWIDHYCINIVHMVVNCDNVSFSGQPFAFLEFLITPHYFFHYGILTFFKKLHYITYSIRSPFSFSGSCRLSAPVRAGPLQPATQRYPCPENSHHLPEFQVASQNSGPYGFLFPFYALLSFIFWRGTPSEIMWISSTPSVKSLYFTL